MLLPNYAPYNVIDTEICTEARLQQKMFVTFWNIAPAYRGQLFHVNNTPRNAVHGATLRGMGLIRGISDLILILPVPNPIWFIEIKLPNQHQTPEQIAFEKLVTKLGHVYVVARTVAEFLYTVHCATNNMPPPVWKP